MSTMTIEEVQTQLTKVIHQLAPGDEVVITENDQPVARLVPTIPVSPKKPRQPGTLRGTVLSMAPDFDAPLDDFKEYME
jgi:antitoxin (DNA-binding transcriptional repressor) of toxin-antitoxin stability system